MALIKITELSALLGVSSRTLRYYEQVGLIQSVRSARETYRSFDEENVQRFRQIMVLRKMQIPVKDIVRIYQSRDMRTVVEAFVRRLDTIDSKIDALMELKRVVNDFLETMLANGVQKISALPLLYEQFDKKLDTLKESPVLRYDTLAAIARRASPPVNIRIETLPAMRMLVSFRRDGPPGQSDADGFWQWALAQGIAPGKPGEGTLFDFQCTGADGHAQTAMLLRVAEDFANGGPYEDIHFAGGLFAVTNAYVDEDLGERMDMLTGGVDENAFYEVDYRHDGSLRQEALVETVLSPDETRPAVKLYLPIKKRVANAALFARPHSGNTPSADAIEQANPVLSVQAVDLATLTPILNPRYHVDAAGEAEFVAFIDKRVLSVDETIAIPFRVDIVFRADRASLRLYHGKAAVMVNVRNTFDLGKASDSLHILDPVFGTEEVYPGKGKIRCGAYNTLTWIVGARQFAVLVNGEVRHCGDGYPYTRLDLRQLKAYPLRIGSNSSDPVHIRQLTLTRLLPPRINATQEGVIIHMARQSNNLLPNIRGLVTWHYGQNYMLCGCMGYLMECLGEKDMDYWFFSGLTGDNLTQVYGLDHQRVVFCASSVLFDAAYVQSLFERCGYEHTLVPEEALNANREMYRQTVVAYIDRGVPVISRSVSGIPDFRIICGYEDHGKTLLYLDGDRTEPERFDRTAHIAEDWLFVGDKKRAIDLATLYRETVEDIPRLITMPEAHACSFGAQAFRDWAADVTSGYFDTLTQEAFDQWRDYTTYVCIYATNCSCPEFLVRAKQLNPDLHVLDEVRTVIESLKALNDEMEQKGIGFGITLATLQDPRRQRVIGEMLERFAQCYDTLLRILTRPSGR